jgi:shikimate dehydrogenase
MTSRVGLIGYPIQHSISPAFQQTAFDTVGLDVCYELWELPSDKLPAVVARLRGADCLGANVTIPHKTAIMAHLDEIDATARQVGAVNTIVRRGNRLVGYNTDVDGFAEALRRDGEFETEGAQVVLCGAGGSSRAVVTALVNMRAARVIICARRIEQAARLIVDLREAALAFGPTILSSHSLDQSSEMEAFVRDADLVVNATPLGMLHRPEATDAALPPSWLHERLTVFDLVYNPPETPLLRFARERGARTLNGLPMLVYQGAAAFEIWTGRAAPIEHMRRSALEALLV